MFNFLKKKSKIIAAVLVVLIVTGGLVLYSIPICRYLMIQGFYQVKVITGRKPISRMLEDPDINSELRKKLLLVNEIKQFGKSLGLKSTDSYSSVYDVGDKPIAYAVSACHKDKLEAVYWNFPIVGRMPYLGYFRKEDAVKQFKLLQKQGYDVIMRPVSAYSTIGFMPDPLFSSLLLGSEEYLANTILHEMTHETIFIKNNMDFNESLANFVGNKAAVEFLKHKYGEDSEQVIQSTNYKHDDEIFSEFIADLYDELDRFYKSPISREEKIRGREKIFQKAKSDFVNKIKPQLLTSSFDYFERINLNNAYMLFNRRYHKEYNVFKELYRLQGEDLKKTITFLKTIRRDKNISKRVKEEINTLRSTGNQED